MCDDIYARRLSSKDEKSAKATRRNNVYRKR
jgi:hypothetical protein